MTSRRMFSQWFLEIFLDGSTLRWCTGFSDTVFDGETYTGLGDRWTPPARVRRLASLKSQSLNLSFDSSRQTDNTDPIGGLLDENWRRRQVRLRQSLFALGETPDDGTIITDERGRIRDLRDTIEPGKSAELEMTIESGVLAYLERRMQTRSPENQRAVFPTDEGFDRALTSQTQRLVWGLRRVRPARPKNPLGERSGVERADTEDPPPRQMALGVFSTEGTFVQSATFGANDKGNTIYQQVVALADHQIESLDQIWFNGVLAHDTAVDGAINHGVRRELPRVSNFVDPKPGKDDKQYWITFYDGRPDQTTSNPHFPEDEWKDNRVLKGVAYVILEVFDFDYSAEPPNARFVGKGAKLYDRRKDDTAGGVGTHRATNPSTWEYSTNAMVAIDHYRIGRRIMNGNTATWFGVGEIADAMPYAEFEDLADLCDEDVTLKGGGTQKRYEVNGFLSAADDHKKNFEKMARAMSARAIDQGGRLSIRPVRAGVSVATIDDSDIVSGEATIASPGGGIEDLANTIEGRFNDENNIFLRNDFPRVSDAAYIAEDGEEITVTLDLDLERNGERAQRLAKLELDRSRRIFKIEDPILLTKAVRDDGSPLLPGDWYTRTSALRGFGAGKLFEIEQIQRNADGVATVTGFEVDPTDGAWDETTASDLSLPVLPTDDTLATEIPDPILAAIEVSAGGVTTPGIQLTFPAPIGYAITTNDYIEIELQVTGDASTKTTKIVESNIDDLTVSGLLPGTEYSFRFRGRAGRYFSDWSASVAITTTGNYVAGSVAGAGPWVTEQTPVFSITNPNPNLALNPTGALGSLYTTGNAASLFLPTFDNVRGWEFKHVIAASTSDADRYFARGGYLLEPGETYTASFDMEVDGLDSRGNVQFYISSNSTNATAGATYVHGVTYSEASIGANFSKRISVTFTVPIGEPYVFLQTQMLSFVSGASGANVRARRYKLEQGSNATPYNEEFQAQNSNGLLTDRVDAALVNSASLLANYRFTEIDVEGKPAGIQPSEGITDRSQLESSSVGMKILGTPDSTVAYGFPAIPIDDTLVYRVVIRHKSSASSASGLYLRFQELASQLPTGKTHIGNASADMNEPRDSLTNVWNNGAMPGTTLIEQEFTYTPTAGTKWASFSAYNWSAFTGDYEVESVRVEVKEVQTDHIAVDAISTRDTDNPSGSASLSNNTWTDVMTITNFVAGGIGIKLSFDFNLFVGGFPPGGNGNLEYRVRRASTTILGPIIAPAINETIDYGGGVYYSTKEADVSRIFFDNPTAGTYTYKVQARISTTLGTPTRTVSERFFEADERKR